MNKYILKAKWGETFTDKETYEFKNYQEVAAFIEGANAAIGWQDWDFEIQISSEERKRVLDNQYC